MIEPLADSSLPLERIDVPRQRRIAVGVDDALARDTVISLLAAGGLPVNAGALPSARSARAVTHAPDALVLIAGGLDAEVLAAVRRMRDLAPTTRIVVVAGDVDPSSQHARLALNAGADAFVPRSAVDRSLAAAVHAVLAGLVCAPREARRVLASRPSRIARRRF